MASGYITSDGKDLDQRYLGIDAKAKSAEIADVATSVEWGGECKTFQLYGRHSIMQVQLI